MDLLASESSPLRFGSYVEELASVIGHADRVVPLHDYRTGRLLQGERKTVEPPQFPNRSPTELTCG